MMLRTRLLMATTTAMLIGLVIVDVVTFTLSSRSQLAQIDATLARSHTPTEQLAAAGDEQSWRLIPELAPGLFVAILDSSGSPLFVVPARAPGGDRVTIDASTLDERARTATVVASGGESMRVRIDPLEGGGTLVIGESLHEYSETRAQLAAVLGIGTLAAVLAVVLLARRLIEVGLRPLDEVESSAASISDEDLDDARVPGAEADTEVGSLARTINDMLDRLEAARVEREVTMRELRESEARMRQFVADASHELRTPLAATSAYAELFEHGARDRPEDLARAMAGVRRETARMAALVEDLLLLARIDDRRPLAREEVDLTDVVLAAVDAARVIEPERRYHTRIDGVVTVPGDPAQLRQVIDNVLTNVRVHAGSDAACTVVLSTVDGQVELTISDDGPGVDESTLGRLKDRFYRADEARTRSTGGAGLGLSIADAIVIAHGGTLKVGRNEPTGVRVSIVLPPEPVALANDLRPAGVTPTVMR